MYILHYNTIFYHPEQIKPSKFCKLAQMDGKEIIDQLINQFQNYAPTLSVDTVILGYQEAQLNVLVLKWKNANWWSLPGGFVYKDESVNDAAQRVLKDRTGINIEFLKQLYVFGETNRRDLEEVNPSFDMLVPPQFKDWFEQRFISIAYLAIVNPNTFSPIPDEMSELCQWCPINDLPNLIFDHNLMVTKAKEYIKQQIKYQPIGRSLLPKQFTMKSYQNLYEVILGKSLDRGNFQKKMLKLGILNRHEKLMKGGAHKAPYLYSFNEKTYNTLLEQGIGLI